MAAAFSNALRIALAAFPFCPHDRLYASCPEYRKMVDLQKLEDEVGGGNA